MNPTVVTFVNSKMMQLAKEQAENAHVFGLRHAIIPIKDETYSTAMWVKFCDLTIDAIKCYGKIMRLDAEVRIHKKLPDTWLQNDNVVFEPYPLVKYPLYIAANTGQIVLGKGGIEFMQTLKECILGMIPPDGDTSLPVSGAGHVIEDELPSAIALRLSKLQYHKEYLNYDRRLNANCRANRGYWTERCTVLTHPAVHNWDWEGAGLATTITESVQLDTFINHFAVDKPIQHAELIAKLLIEKKDNPNLWNSIGIKIDASTWEVDNWKFNPTLGLCGPNGRKLRKLISQQPSIVSN